MGASVSRQDIRNLLSTEMTQEQVQNLEERVDRNASQFNTVSISNLTGSKVDGVSMTNDLSIATSLDLVQKEAERLNLSQDLQSQLEAIQQTSGLFALSSSNQQIVAEARTKVDIKQITNVIRNTRETFLQGNALSISNLSNTTIRNVNMGNKLYNSALTTALLDKYGDLVSKQTAAAAEAAAQKTTGLDLAEIFKALTGPLLIVGTVAVVFLLS